MLFLVFFLLISFNVYGGCENAESCLTSINYGRTSELEITLSEGFDEDTTIMLKRTDDIGSAGCTEVNSAILFSTDGGSTYATSHTINTTSTSYTIKVPFCQDSITDNLFCDCSDSTYGTSSFTNSDGMYTLSLYNSSDEDDSEDYDLIIDHNPPTVPGTPVVESGDTKLKISWTGSVDTNAKNTASENGSGLLRYNVTLVPANGSDTITTTTEEPEVEVKDLANNVKYTVSVTATDYLENTSASSGTAAGFPLPISGFLSENTGCFIATATYGDYNHPLVVVYREFRDKILLHSEFGRDLVKVYYKYSPRYAGFIENSLPLRSISLVILSFGTLFLGIILMKPTAIAAVLGIITISIVAAGRQMGKN
jgi:hypothetical protein